MGCLKLEYYYPEMQALRARKPVRSREAKSAQWFTTPDLLAEKYYNISPYAYCMNNPVRFVDPKGTTVYFYAGTNSAGNIPMVDFSKLDKNVQEWFYGWASSDAGQKFLSNFVDKEQSFTWDGNTVTIKGNGNNYDARYSFGEGATQFGSNPGFITGTTEWSLENEKPAMRIHTDIYQSTADQIVTFGHEQTVHAEGDVDFLNKNFVKGAANNSQLIDRLNSSGSNDHAIYDNQQSSKYLNMRKFVYGMMGWMGTSDMDKALLKAFEEEYQNNKENVKNGN